MAVTNPTPEETLSLIQEIEQKFPSSTLGSNKWEILALTTICAGGHAPLAADLYKYLIAKPEYSSPGQRQALMRRLRECLVKLVSIVGVVKPLESCFAMADIESEEDKDYSFSRENWESGPENQKRGTDWLMEIYRHNDASTKDRMAAHKDFRWLSIEITYGLYLSDHTILDKVDTELIVLAGIMIQNCPLETGWHLRGTRRIGVSYDDVETIQQITERVAAFCGLKLTRIPRVKDIEHEVDAEA